MTGERASEDYLEEDRRRKEQQLRQWVKGSSYLALWTNYFHTLEIYGIPLPEAEVGMFLLFAWLRDLMEGRQGFSH